MSIFLILKNSWQTPFALYNILAGLRRQKKFLQTHIQPHINKALAVNDGSISREDLKKINQYYGLAVPAILGEGFALLNGQGLSSQERLATTCQGAITGLGDDFFDNNKFSEAALKDFLENPHHFKANNAANELFLHFYTNSLSQSADADKTLKRLKAVYQAQLQSMAQANRVLDTDSILEISMLKGGCSLLFYRSAFKHPVDSNEEEALFLMGGLMQISNDVFDVYKDSNAGIQTLMSTCKKVDYLRNLYKDLLKKAYVAIYKTNYNKKNIKQFINLVSIAVFSRCFVCFDQLEKAADSSGGIFTPADYTRKQLICDMDTAANKWASILYHIKYAF